ncbi:ClpP/crotonase [Tilletiaria anomala UBC 951]|uniref:ClpP/crotonase n=1 Tax=Tilletiaria anomala (strain ATCC 24038 / CBS 436.72 / UBC 951) TaxID=1037660 RepID=A0A066WE71_TILAU|nr:ClpP/crotonase [Tilletiaria anomala UBC 951]KDN52071.1 ClpP/crotonase [Tilletiaria anomala UBC 951]
MSLAALPAYSHVILSRFARCPTFISLELNDVATFNSLTPDMFQCMARALQWCAKEKTVHAVVFSGRGRGADKSKHVFCSGMGMSKETAENAFANPKGVSLREVRARVVKGPLDFIDTIIDFPKLLVAACNGHAFGMAVTMLPLFDFVYALPGLTFRTPFSELGVCAEGCSSATFPAILGPGLASKMLYYAEPQTSEKLLPSGFISEIVPDKDSTTLPEWVLNHLCDRLGVDDVNITGASTGLPTSGPRAASASAAGSGAPSQLPNPLDWRNLSLQSILYSKSLVMHKDRRRFLHEVNAKEMEAVAGMVASPEFAVGIGRFMAKQAAKKAKL